MLQIHETRSAKYPPRTFHNAKTADLTLAFAVNFNTSGEKLTKKAAGEKYLGIAVNAKLELDIDLDSICKLFQENNVKCLNIAGNSLPTLELSGITQEQIDVLITQTIRQIHRRHPLTQIITGGQTGVDLAGARAGYICNIPITVTMPKGFLQRNSLGIDTINTKSAIEAMIINN